MKTCIFCQNTDHTVANINKCDDHERTAKDYMLEFFGHQIEDRLRDEDSICHGCLYLMQIAAELKRTLLPLIDRSRSPAFKTDSSGKLAYLKKILKTFDPIKLAQDNDNLDQSNSGLLKRTRQEDYNYLFERELQDRQRPDEIRETPSNDDNSKKKGRRTRRRGHGWTRPKRRSCSAMSKRYSDSPPNGRYSSLSTQTRYTPISVRSDIASPRFDFSSSRSNSSYPARSSVTFSSIPKTQNIKVHVDSLPADQDEDAELQVIFHSLQFYECNENGCTFTCQDPNFMARHKADKHRCILTVSCDICYKKYQTVEDMENHRKKKHSNPITCVICYRNFYSETDLTSHWKEEHVRKAVTCNYCGKRFVNRKICNNHEDSAHKQNMLRFHGKQA